MTEGEKKTIESLLFKKFEATFRDLLDIIL